MTNTESFKIWESVYDSHKEAFRPASEFDWFAIDSKGQIACFMTAGVGLVPKLVFRDKEMLWEIYNYFYTEPEEDIKFSKTYTRMEYDVSLYADRGIYSYDNPSDMLSPYEKIKSPEKPIFISDLPIRISQWLEPLTLKNLDFHISKRIDMHKQFECI